MKIIAKFTSMAALRAAIQKEMYEALQETVEDSYQDLKKNTDYFYDAPEGRYKRTGQLMNSPQVKEVSFSGDFASGEVSIDTDSPHYVPAGRSVQEIYGYAENNSLIGNGGFWQKTQDDIEKNIEESFGKRFDKA